MPKNMNIEDVDMSVRLQNSLIGTGINTLDDAFKLTDDDLSNMRNLGKRGRNELKEILRKHNYYTEPTDDIVEEYSFRPSNLQELLETMQPREKLLLCHYYGLLGESKKTLVLICKILNLTKGTVLNILKKCHWKLRNKERGRFFVFLPDSMLQDIYGTIHIDDIFNLYRVTEHIEVEKEFENMKESIIEAIDKKNRELERFAKDVKDNYVKFVETLQGSELMKFLGHIDNMALKLHSQATNIQLSLSTAQKFINTEVKLPHEQLSRMFGDLDMRIFEIKEVFIKLESLYIDNIRNIEYNRKHEQK